jgi:hypothetical protein
LCGPKNIDFLINEFDSRFDLTWWLPLGAQRKKMFVSHLTFAEDTNVKVVTQLNIRHDRNPANLKC